MSRGLAGYAGGKTFLNPPLSKPVAANNAVAVMAALAIPLESAVLHPKERVQLQRDKRMMIRRSAETLSCDIACSRAACASGFAAPLASN
jgi:hypothetical protein